MRTAVIGHVEWVELLRVQRVPAAGEIVHAKKVWEGPGGGGPGAAAQLAKLSEGASLFTALGDDALGKRAQQELEGLGIDLHISWRDEPTRRAFTYIDAQGERTITVIGDRLGPFGSDDLPWEDLKNCDGAYFTAGDEEALRRSRASRVLVATSRVLDLLLDARVQLDALVGSGSDPAESYRPGLLRPPPRLVVMTAGSSGGHFWSDPQHATRFEAPSLSEPIADRYGAGDSFAGGLTYALASGAKDADAVMLAARCGTAALRGIGPFAGQLRKEQLRFPDESIPTLDPDQHK